MGYLSQKKKQARIKFFFEFAAFFSVAFTVGVFWDLPITVKSHITDWYFQYYLLMLALFGAALYSKRFLPALTILLCIIINFVRLGVSTNIFLNTPSSGDAFLTVVYQNHLQHLDESLSASSKEEADVIALNADNRLSALASRDYQLFHNENLLDKSFIYSRLDALHAGKVHFSPRYEASYLSFDFDGHKGLLLNVDFSKLAAEEAAGLYNNLTEFVLEQNLPVIIIGDFGLPSWSDTFQNFLLKTGLEIKNRVILSDGSSLFNPFVRPSLNVLGYKTMGLKEIRFLDKADNPSHPLLFQLIL